MVAVPSEQLITVFWMWSFKKQILNFETVLHAQMDQWRGPAKFVETPKTWNHLVPGGQLILASSAGFKMKTENPFILNHLILKQTN